ncbi:helix-turn-helix domain-containing protein [Ilumatobacter sp.]|uniref:helix-turn-helix domain-containing protein n=1 Tax=Ilumatobacter sp. TaxID=1967498 RepID=UPI003B53052F
MTDLVERAVAIRLGDRGQATPALAELVVGVERGGLVVHDASGVRRDSLDDVMAALGRRPAWRRPVIGDAPMTDREAVVSRGVARGATTRELAEELGVSERTVTTLRRRLREREPAAEVVGGSRGVSVVGAPGLTRDVVHTCLRAERADVNEVPSVRADDRVRVMVAPTVRDFAAVGSSALRRRR